MKERQMNPFDAAVLRQIGHIRAIGRRLLRDRSELDDFVQETVLRVYSNRAQLRDPAKLKQWIAGVARNTALEWNRKKREIPIADVDAIPADEQSPHDDLERAERNERVRQALGMLKPVDRELLLARYMEEATYEELQKRHGLSYSAVGFRLFKARQRLKKLLTAMKIALALALSSMKQNAHGGVLIMTKSTKIALVAAAAALIALVSGVWTAKQIQSGSGESMDGSKAERAAGGSGMSIPLDETGQSPRLRPMALTGAPKKQETQATIADGIETQDMEGAGARNEGEEQMTETDYSSWDSTAYEERVGIFVRSDAAAKGRLLGVARTEITIPLEDGTQLEYYRRRSDGSLMRQATLANGQVKRWVAAPPPDLSGFSAGEIKSMREAWRPE